MAIKNHCDLCDKVIKLKGVSSSGGLFFKKTWKIVEYFEVLDIHIFYPLPNKGKSLIMCEDCIEDFKDYIKRKNVFLNN